MEGDWYAEMVRRILQNPRYCGTHVYGKTSQKFKTVGKRLPSASWVTVPGAWTPIVSPETFKEAQLRFQSQARLRSDAQLLHELRQIAGRTGFVRAAMLNPLAGDASINIYRSPFGSYSEAVAAAGLVAPKLNYTLARRNKVRLRTELMENIVKLSNFRVSIFRPWSRGRPLLKLRNGTLVSVYVCSSRSATDEPAGWLLRRPARDRDRVTLVALLDSSNQHFQEVRILPKLPWKNVWSIIPADPHFRGGVILQSFSDFEVMVRQLKATTRKAPSTQQAQGIQEGQNIIPKLPRIGRAKGSCILVA